MCHVSNEQETGYECLKSIGLKSESYHMSEHPRLIHIVKFDLDRRKGSLLWIGGTLVPPTIQSSFKLVMRDSQVLAKLGVVTIFFIGWGGGGGYN